MWSAGGRPYFVFLIRGLGERVRAKESERESTGH
jgi:hypothetical protein